ncbi:MAG: hypothetical protein NVS9B1_11930 [Candidatus Dormibacteraceae bacterium]
MTGRQLALTAACLLLTGCGGGSTTAAQTTPAPATPSPVERPLAFPMLATGATPGVSGTVTVVKKPGNAGFTITIELKGMPPNSVHVSHIHKGTCAKNGPILIPLPNSVAADASGHATSINEIASAYLPSSPDDWYANVHTGPDLSSGANAAPFACGDLKPAA